MKKIGIFGGTFDPVHIGHTSLAEDAMKQIGLDKVIFVPAKFQPFKLDRETASGKDRVKMLKLAVMENERFEVSEYELNSESVSYTYLTMRAMREHFGKEAELFFITGTDSFLKIETWKNSEELLTGYSYIIGTRPGYREDDLIICMKYLAEKYGTNIVNILNTQRDISSTEIRNLLKSGHDVNELLHGSVERYIRENGLYK